MKTRDIIITAYNSDWPCQFEKEAGLIQDVLGENCLAIHHVGSTAVPGLVAKPKIDIIVVVKDPTTAIKKLQSIGFDYRGEYNIPFHYGFSKRGELEVNLHMYEEGHPEIELNLMFRDYLRAHPEIRDEYAAIKQSLLKEKSSFEKNNSMFTGYNLGKGSFIRKVLEKAGFRALRFVRCTHYEEWEGAKRMRQRYFFDPLSISDPHEWTFNHPDHVHFILSLGMEFIGYAHIQLWPDSRAAIRIIVIDEAKRSSHFGTHLLSQCERWLAKERYKSLHTESRANAVDFYIKNGYVEMPFKDPEHHESHPDDIAVGKWIKKDF